MTRISIIIIIIINSACAENGVQNYKGTLSLTYLCMQYKTNKIKQFGIHMDSLMQYNNVIDIFKTHDPQLKPPLYRCANH